MNDLELVKELFSRVGVPFVPTNTQHGRTTYTLEENSSSLIKGYYGFYTDFVFVNEELIEVGIWE